MVSRMSLLLKSLSPNTKKEGLGGMLDQKLMFIDGMEHKGDFSQCFQGQEI